jgi:hypothetical protein
LEHGSQFKNIGERMKRTENEIRNLFNSKIKKSLSEKDLEKIQLINSCKKLLKPKGIKIHNLLPFDQLSWIEDLTNPD